MPDPLTIPDHVTDAARQVRTCAQTHDGACLFCLNLTSWMGEVITSLVARRDQEEPTDA